MSKLRTFRFNVYNQKNIDELKDIDGIGFSQIDSLKKFFLNKQNLIIVSSLIKLTNVQSYKVSAKKTPFTGKLIMFTGTFKNKSRSELKVIAENLGAKIVSKISKKTNFLVVGSEKPTTRKVLEAKNLNVRTLTEKDWDKIISE